MFVSIYHGGLPITPRLADATRQQIIDLALAEPELSTRELAVHFTDQQRYFVSQASVYRLLKAHNLIASPAYIVVKAAIRTGDISIDRR